MNEPTTNRATPEDGGPQQVPAAPAVTPSAKPRQSSGRWTNVLLALAAIVAVGGIAFAVGRSTAPAQAAGPGGLANGVRNLPGQAPGSSFDPGTGLRPFGGGMTLTGTVSAINGTSMTLTTSDGQTVTVDVGGSTYHAQTSASASDVTAGSSVKVTVNGAGGFGGPAPSGAPNGAGSGSATTLSATDVTIVSE